MRSETALPSGAAAPASGRPAAVFCRHGGAWRSPLDRRQLCRVLAAMCEAAAVLGRPVEGVELHLLTDSAMSRANAEFLGCPGPTNVLSFPGAHGMAGSLLLSLDTLDRECLFYGQEPREHLLRLLAHGMGHLAGLDHGPEMDALCVGMKEAAEAVLAA